MSASPQVRGSQRPTFEHAPACVGSRGDEVIAFAAKAGLHLDEWQQYVLRQALGVRADGKWAAFEVGLVVPRQNGKGSILEALMLADLFLWRESLTIYSAHEFKTAQETFRRLRFLIEGCPDLLRQVKGGAREIDSGPTAQGARGFKVSTNETGVELESGERIRFLARSGGAGRGFTGRKLYLDEAYALVAAEMAAVLPTLSTADNPQVWYTSSAGRAESDHLRSIRDRGRNHEHADDLSYLEWCARSATPDPDDISEQAAANPSAGHRISFEYIARERAALSGELGVPEYLRERLGIWDDPRLSPPIFGEGEWEACSSDSKIDGEKTIVADISPNRDWAALAVAGYNTDGRVHVELTGKKREPDHRKHTAWLLPRLVELANKHDARVALLVGAGSAAASLIPGLEAEGIDAELIPTSEVSAACGWLYDAVLDRRLTHIGQPALDQAVEDAAKKDVGDGAFAWARRKSLSDITPLYAVTLAAWLVAKDGDYKLDDSFK